MVKVTLRVFVLGVRLKFKPQTQLLFLSSLLTFFLSLHTKLQRER